MRLEYIQTALNTSGHMPGKTTMETKGMVRRERVKADCVVSSGLRVCGLTKAKLL